MVEAHAFRAKVYSSLGIDLPPVQHPDGAQGLPRNVTLLDRQRSEPRHITKVDDTLNMIRKYGMEPNHVIVKFENTFEEQVRLMASTGVFISVHGAGLMNEIFMRPGSVVIEIFPNHMKHILYERIAGYAGLYHFKVFANEHPGDLHEKHPDYDQHKCEGVRSLDLPGRPDCWRVVKNVVVVVPLRDLEVAFSSALDFLDRTPLLPVAAPTDTKT